MRSGFTQKEKLARFDVLAASEARLTRYMLDREAGKKPDAFEAVLIGEGGEAFEAQAFFFTRRGEPLADGGYIVLAHKGPDFSYPKVWSMQQLEEAAREAAMGSESAYAMGVLVERLRIKRRQAWGMASPVPVEA